MKNPLTHRLIHSFSILILAHVLSACTETGYFVSTAGSDENPGTRGRPFKTIAKVNTLVLRPGDKIFFKGGEAFQGPLSLTVNGTKEDPVFIGSYGDGMPTINGGKKEAIIIRGNYFVLSNLHAIGSGRKTGNTTNGVSLANASNGKVDNIKTEGFQKSGLDLYNCEYIKVKNIYAFNNGFGGINVSGDDRTKSKNILIKDSKAENNPGDPTNLDNHSGNGILVGMSDSVLVDRCVATNNGWDMPRVGNGPVGIWAYETSNITIQYCISYGNKTSKGGKDGGGFDLDGGVTNSIIQYCLSYDNEGAGYGLFQYAGASLWYNNIVRYCISINDATATEGSGGIFMWNGAQDSVQLADCIVHNNLIYTIRAPAIQFEPNSLNKSFRFSNNIIIGNGEVVHGPSSGEKFSGNIWWSTPGSTIKFRGHTDLTAWARATGQETSNGVVIGRQIDPALKGPLTTNLIDPHQLNTLFGYTLQNNSPLINTGVSIHSFSLPSATHDFYGTALPQSENIDIGIYEWPEK